MVYERIVDGEVKGMRRRWERAVTLSYTYLFGAFRGCPRVRRSLAHFQKATLTLAALFHALPRAAAFAFIFDSYSLFAPLYLAQARASKT